MHKDFLSLHIKLFYIKYNIIFYFHNIKISNDKIGNQSHLFSISSAVSSFLFELSGNKYS